MASRGGLRAARLAVTASATAALSHGLSHDELAAWLRLLECPGVSRLVARRLLRAFGTPQAVFEAPAAQRRDCAGPAADALDQPDPALEGRIAATWAWLQAAPAHRVLTLADADFPQALLQTADPPLLLYATGDTSWLNRPALAVVGSRNPTAQGEENARAFGAALSHAGLVVVSGLAHGIDGAAHEGALQGPTGTVAVVGTGLDRVYPKGHHELAHRIAGHGVLLSEFALGTPPLRPNFPQRNRIIAGLGLGTLVVEATLRSGSLITARLAAECGRDVFAVPGSIHSPQAHGCHELIRQGAKLVAHTGDILAELRLPDPAPGPVGASAVPATAAEAEDPVLQALGFDPQPIEVLLDRTGWPLAQLSAHLLSLELEGRIARLPGPLFQRLVTA